MAATATAKPKRSRREAEVIAAIGRYRDADDQFLSLADQAADRQDDPAFDRAFAAADAEHIEATAQLWPFVYPGQQKPVIYEGFMYAPSPNRRGEQMSIVMVGVHVLD